MGSTIRRGLTLRSLRRRECVAMLAALAWVPPGQGWAGSDNAGFVDSVEGAAFAGLRQQKRELWPSAPIFLGDLVETGNPARLAMHLGDKTLLRLGADARITIDRFLVSRGGEITLKSGAMLFDRPEGAKPASFLFRSPFGAIAVRGTRFFAGPSNDVFGVFVERGRVEVSAAGRKVVLGPGEGTNIPSPGAPPSPPTRWGEPRIAAALASVT